MTKRQVCPLCKGCGHIIVLNWSEHCPKCKRTGFIPAEKPAPAFGVTACPAPQCKNCQMELPPGCRGEHQDDELCALRLVKLSGAAGVPGTLKENGNG